MYRIFLSYINTLAVFIKIHDQDIVSGGRPRWAILAAARLIYKGKAQLMSSIHVQEWRELDGINTVDLCDGCASCIIAILGLGLYKAYNIVK